MLKGVALESSPYEKQKRRLQKRNRVGVSEDAPTLLLPAEAVGSSLYMQGRETASIDFFLG